jgi:hypothetical protein
MRTLKPRGGATLSTVLEARVQFMPQR